MISRSVRALAHTYRDYVSGAASELDVADAIHVDEVAFRIARFYDRVRNLIDYQEEHLLRKRVIFRALQRRVFLGESKEKMGEGLIKEIIRSGHLPNDSIHEEKIEEVNRLIYSLSFLLEAAKERHEKQRKELTSWLVRIYAAAIEECLDPPVKDMLTADTMFHMIQSRLTIKGAELDETMVNAQLYIAIQRALLRVDDDQLSYRFIRYTYPEWDKLGGDSLEHVASTLPDIKGRVDAYLEHDLAPHFFKLCNTYNTAFYILSDIVLSNEEVLKNFDEVMVDEEEVEDMIREAYRLRYARQKRKLSRLAFFSVISLFITKVIIALAIEIPIDMYVLHEFSLSHTVLNILVPPALMFLIIAFIRMPSKKNESIVTKEVRSLIYEEESHDYVIVFPKRRRPFAAFILRIAYAAVFIAVVYGFSNILLSYGFSVASIAVFILFVSLVAATGARVQNRSKEISMEKERVGFLRFIGDLLAMPFINIGMVVIRGLSKFHVLVMIVNFIDLPFQLFINFVEGFYSFIRSKREEIY